MYKLFLDDERFPVNSDWIIVRNCGDAIQYVIDHGLPMEISFDHDLGGDQTAMEFVHWLINGHLDGRFDLTTINYYVHSRNPVGKQNIEGLLDSFFRHAVGN